MSFELQFFGATGEVTGSLYVLRTGSHTVLLECGLIQGGAENEKRNSDPFPGLGQRDRCRHSEPRAHRPFRSSAAAR